MKMTLSARPPFSLPAVVKSHGWVRLAPFGEDDRTAALTYVGRLDSERVVEMRIQEATGGVSIQVDSSLSDAECDQVARQVERMLGLNQDLATFYELARAEPKLAQTRQPLGP